MTDRGLLYVASGEKYVREASESAASARRWMPDVSIALFTTTPDAATASAFDTVIELPAREWVRSEAKVWALPHTPFERTLFIDADTRVCDDLGPAFDVLDKFEVAGVPVPGRLFKRGTVLDQSDIPSSFMALNSGLLAYRLTPATVAMFEEWEQLYDEDKRARPNGVFDQHALRVALWRSECRLIHLAPEYNLRCNSFPLTAAGKVKVLHGRPYDMDALERRFNASTEHRIVIASVRPWVSRALDRWHHRLPRGTLSESLRHVLARRRR